MDEIELNNKIEERLKKVMPRYLQKGAFMDRKLTDTPTDDFQVTSRRYVNLYGTTRPISSVIGQRFLDMNLASGRGVPIQWNGIGWTDSGGNYV